MNEYEEQSRLKDKEKLKLLIETLDRNAALAVKGEPYQKVGVRFVALRDCRYDEGGRDIIDQTALFCNENADGDACDFIDGEIFKQLFSQYLTYFTEVLNTERKYRRFPKRIFGFGVKMVEGDFSQEKPTDDHGFHGLDLILEFDFDQIGDMMEVIKLSDKEES